MQAFKQTLGDLIAFNTISSDSNLEMIDYCANRLDALGARIEIVKDPTGQKANVFASIGPNTDDGIVLSGHTDVVPVAQQAWTHDPFEMIERDGKLFGRGTCDMKGFIAASLEAAKGYAKLNLKRPVHFAFTYEEEVGCIGAKHLCHVLEQRGQKASVAIVGEPTDLKVIEGHKGISEYTVRFKGLAGHGSRPELGVNCAEYATRYVSKLLELRDWLKSNAPADCPFLPPYGTINVGKIHAGIAHNVIPDFAEVEWEMRPVQSGEAEHVRETMAHYCETVLLPAMRAVDVDADIQLQIVGDVIGLAPATDNEARDICCALTGNEVGLVSFGTEAGLFQALGMSVVVCGPGSIEQAHKPDEYLSLEQAALCQQMLHDLGERLI
ncbi:MAG: acetylornithine deacetylase [Gammaproteobacteria bacterium]|nr:acetylornithine deacetylase [Gammaproteobacteria bacterium]